jgi:hypothetical protein
MAISRLFYLEIWRIWGTFSQKSFEEVSALFPSFCVWPSGEIATQKNAGSAGMRFLQLNEP